MKLSRLVPQIFGLMLLAGVVLSSFLFQNVHAASSEMIDKEVDLALEKLYATSETAKDFSHIAKGILVFPDVVEAGLIVGGQYGEGALRVNGKTIGYYSTAAGSFGLQAGAQSFGYVMFLMTKDALNYLEKSKGWEIGVGPTVVLVDKGMAGNLSSSTAKEDVYAFFFDQQGLMAGISLEGSKITKITPD